MNNNELDLNRANYNDAVHNMKRFLEHFYTDFSREYTSFYSLLNKLNNEMKNNPDLQNRAQKLRSTNVNTRNPT